MRRLVCCGVPEKGKWAGGCLDLIKLCMKSWWLFQQSHKHRIRWVAAGRNLESEHQASTEGNLRIVLPLAEDQQLSTSAGAGERNLQRLPIPKMSAWQKQLFFCSKQLCCKIALLHQCRPSPEGFQQIHSVVNEGQFRRGKGFTIPSWLCSEVSVDLSMYLHLIRDVRE